jgi:hypothetical protein
MTFDDVLISIVIWAVWLAVSMAAWWLAVRLSICRWEDFVWPLRGLLVLAFVLPFIFHLLAASDQSLGQWAALACWPAVPLVVIARHLATASRRAQQPRDTDARNDPITLGTRSLAQTAAASSVISIVFTLSVWTWVLTRHAGAFNREGAMLLTLFAFPATFIVWLFCALPFTGLGRPSCEGLSIPDAARIKTLRKFAYHLVLWGFLLATVGNLVVMVTVCR